MSDSKPSAEEDRSPVERHSEEILAAKYNFFGLIGAAIIGLIGTIATGYFIYNATIWPGKATQTAEARAALFTPVPTTPAPTQTQPPVPTNTPSPTASPTPTTTPTATQFPGYKSTASSYLKLADFETCQDDVGVASPDHPKNSLTFKCLQVADHAGNVMRLEYVTPSQWASFWLDLQGMDFSQYDILTFFSRAEAAQTTPPWFKVELRRKDGSRLGVSPVTGVAANWQQFDVPLNQFTRFGNEPALCGWDEMTQLIFTFEAERSGPGGVLYLDDLYLEHRQGNAPAPDPQLCNLLISDFESGTAFTLLGGEMGAACPQRGCPASDSLAASYVNEPGHTIVARLEVHLKTWSAFWMKLNGLDLTPYSQLVFDLRADNSLPPPDKIKLELKQGENLLTAIYFLHDVSAQWQTFRIDLSNFRVASSNARLGSWRDMAELVFTFEAENGRDGIVYLDNVMFTR